MGLASLGSACFPEGHPPWLEEPEDVLPSVPQVPIPSDPPPTSPFTAPRVTNPVEICPRMASGLAASLVEEGAASRVWGVGAETIRDYADGKYLQDEFALPVALVARERPMAVGCIEEQLTDGFLASASGSSVVAEMINHASVILGAPAWEVSGLKRGSFADAVVGICALYQMERDGAAEGCVIPQSMPSDLAEALGPTMWAIYDGLAVRKERDETLTARTPDWWRDHGGHNLFPSKLKDSFNADFDEDRAYLHADRGKLYGAAEAIARAITAVPWDQFAGKAEVKVDIATPAGWIWVRGSEADNYPATTEDILLLIDLGGDDKYLHQVASNTSGANAVSVAIDLGGNDRYIYPEAENVGLAGIRLPTDPDGTITEGGKVQGASASESSRQGAARNGIAMLFDLGDGQDSYLALRASQGYAHQGVGVIFDAGGHDYYWAEDGSQGAGQFGIGLLIDAGVGQDTYRSSHASQGFGYVGGMGLLFDEGGNDDYECHPDHNGQPAYTASQLPGKANASMCQGAGLGFRIRDERYSMSGGIGFLLDVEGNDNYTGGVYVQGTGYWQGFGLLADRNGEDNYDALYYAQGAAAHFGVGMLADGGGGDDNVGFKLSAETFVMGAAQDFSVGVFINEDGDDAYKFAPVSGGVASCGSVSMFIDNQGEDMYQANVGLVAGYATVASCGSNHGLTSSALFLDVGGVDFWNLQGGNQTNDRTWAFPDAPTDDARAFAQDVASGDSGIHLGPQH